MSKTTQHANLIYQARLAGHKAGLEHTPTPMVVSGSGGYREVVSDGVCGFAYVNISPGTSSFARYLVKQGIARKGYYGGVEISIHEYNQSCEKKMAHAEAMAKYLRDNGINANARSHVD